MSAPDPARGRPGDMRPHRAAQSLLDGIAAESLDPSYAAEARRRSAAGPTPGFPWRRLAGLLAFAVAGLMLVSAAQQAQARRLPAAERRESLTTQIAERTADLSQREANLRALRAEVRQRQQQDLAGGPGGADRIGRLATAQAAAATSAVRGPGIVLTIDDAPGTRSSDTLDPRDRREVDAGRVRDRDLQAVVNGLWAAGAEAITVGEHRLTSLTAIRAAGLAVLVDYKYVLPPYEIRAIGDPAALATTVQKGAVAQHLSDLRNDVGIVHTVEYVEDLSLPGAEPGSLRWADPVGGGTGAEAEDGSGRDGAPTATSPEDPE